MHNYGSRQKLKVIPPNCVTLDDVVDLNFAFL